MFDISCYDSSVFELMILVMIVLEISSVYSTGTCIFQIGTLWHYKFSVVLFSTNIVSVQFVAPRSLTSQKLHILYPPSHLMVNSVNILAFFVCREHTTALLLPTLIALCQLLLLLCSPFQRILSGTYLNLIVTRSKPLK